MCGYSFDVINSYSPPKNWFEPYYRNLPRIAICFLYFNTLTTPSGSNNMCTQFGATGQQNNISTYKPTICNYIVSVLFQLKINFWRIRSIIFVVPIQSDLSSSPQFFLLVNSNEFFQILVIRIYLNIL